MVTADSSLFHGRPVSQTRSPLRRLNPSPSPFTKRGPRPCWMAALDLERTFGFPCDCFERSG
jgi:hypothetical protein